MKVTCSWLKICGFLLFLTAFACGLPAFSAEKAAASLEPAVKHARPATGAAVTLVGRGNRAAEVRKDGTVTELAPRELVLVNKGKNMRDWFQAPAPLPKPQKEAGEESSVVEEAAKAGRDEGEKAVEEALKESDKEAIRKMREGAYMWFFDEKGKVMTNQELDRRLKTGNLNGIKAVSDDRQEWTPSSGKKQE